jgi:hypothetical protein
MDFTIRDVSIDKLLKDTSLIFFNTEKSLPKETFLPESITNHYLTTLQLLLLTSAVTNQFSVDMFHHFSIFLSYIVKSTLYFLYCFDHPIQDSNAKLALMYGDLYLVKGGEHFVKIKNYLRLHASFRELLYSISLSQRMQEKSKNLSSKDFEKIITTSFGYIFRFALISPYLYMKNTTFEKRNHTQLATYISLFLAWQIQPFLFSCEFKQERIDELFTKIRMNLGEVIFHEYNFDGWKNDIQKVKGGNVSNN